jgi:hypothetical protein
MKSFEAVWEKRFRTIADKYDMDIACLEEHPMVEDPSHKFLVQEKTEDLTCRNNRMYRVKNYPNTYRMFLKDRKIATCAELRGGWSHTNNPSYYEEVSRDDSIFTPNMPRLKNV